MDCLDFLAVSGLRKDGRRPDEVRSVRCRLGRSSSAGAHGARVDGSAYLEMGLTKVLALVSGPHEARRSAEQHDRATLACTCSLASFAGPERKRRRTADAGGDRGGSGSDRQLAEVALAMQRTLETAVVTSAAPDKPRCAAGGSSSMRAGQPSAAPARARSRRQKANAASPAACCDRSKRL